MDFQSLFPPATKFVKTLVMINAVVWFFGIVIAEQYFMQEPWLTMNLGLVPAKVLHGYIWQPLTYLFIHSVNPMHIIFNMLMLWWMGTSLERMFGTRFFVLFYFVSGIGAALLYTVAVMAYAFFTGKALVLAFPVIGASAAIFGLFMAYGIYFGEQTVLFMFFFPMKARVMVALLAAMEVVMVLNNGPVQGKVANLAHVGGLITGYLFLKIWPRIGGGKGRSNKPNKPKRPKASKLKLVVNNNEFDGAEKPKYWN